MLNRIYPGQQGDPPERGAAGILESYSHMPWVRACAGKVAGSMAAVEWRLYVTRKGKGANRKAYRDRSLQRAGSVRRKGLLTERANMDELDEITDHPFLDLLTRGNGYHTGVAIRRKLPAQEPQWAGGHDGALAHPTDLDSGHADPAIPLLPAVLSRLDGADPRLRSPVDVRPESGEPVRPRRGVGASGQRRSRD